jgi:hypothetical protein
MSAWGQNDLPKRTSDLPPRASGSRYSSRFPTWVPAAKSAACEASTRGVTINDRLLAGRRRGDRKRMGWGPFAIKSAVLEI